MLKTKIIISIISATSLCLLLAIMNLTTPAANGPFGILAVFVFMYIFLFGLVAFLISWVGYSISYFSTLFILRQPLGRISFRHSCYFATIIAAAPVMLIGLRSVGSSGFYGTCLVFLFVIIGCFYIRKRIG